MRYWTVLAFLLLSSCSQVATSQQAEVAIDASKCREDAGATRDRYFCNSYFMGRRDGFGALAGALKKLGQPKPKSPELALTVDMLEKFLDASSKPFFERISFIPSGASPGEIAKINSFANFGRDFTKSELTKYEIMRREYYINGAFSVLEYFCSQDPRNVRSKLNINCTHPSTYLDKIDEYAKSAK